MKPIKTNPTLKNYQTYTAEMAEERGFSDGTIPELFMYLSEEVGEMTKAARQSIRLHCDNSSNKFELAHEIADVFNYLLDIANHFDIDLETAFREKEEINNRRAWNKKGE